MSENKKFPLSIGDIAEILTNSGCRVSMVRPYTKIEMSTIDTPISIPDGEMEVDISGGASCFLSGMESIFSKCSTDHADAAKDQEIAELRQQLAADQNHIEQLRAALDKRASHLTMKIEVDKPRIITALEKCIQEISEAVDDAGIGSDLDKPITPHVTTQDAISEVMAAMHEDESESLKNRLGKFTATVISAMREAIAEDAKKVIGKISEQAAIQDCATDGDDWIEWDGNVTRPLPVPFGTRIEYKLRSGYIGQRPCASMLIWRHCGECSDIIAYRMPK